jgi:hypothetical protein
MAISSRHAAWIDRAQCHYIAGFQWAVPVSLMLSITDETVYIPMMLRPHCSMVAVGIKACFENGSSNMIQANIFEDASGATQLGLSPLQLTADDIGSESILPESLQAWQLRPWYGSGTLGYDEAPAATKSGIQVVPVNYWRRCFLCVEVPSDAKVWGLWARPICDSGQVTDAPGRP